MKRILVAILVLFSAFSAEGQYRAITINGVKQFIDQDRSWTVTAVPSSADSQFTRKVAHDTADILRGWANARFVQLGGSYSNPSWISSLAWSKITGTPTTVAGYGITDGMHYSDTVALSNRIDDAGVTSMAFNTGTGDLTVYTGGGGFYTSLDGRYLKGADTAGINARINLKLNSADTAGLSARINLKLNSADTVGLSNRINLKLNSADTVGLSSRINLKLNSADTAGLSSRINLKLNSADTVGLSNRINLKLNSADTVGLSNRINSKVTSVSNSDGTLTISPTSGAVVGSLALGHANTWAAQATYSVSGTGSAGVTDNLFTMTHTLSQSSTAASKTFVINRVENSLGTGLKAFQTWEVSNVIRTMMRNDGTLDFGYDPSGGVTTSYGSIRYSANGGSTATTGTASGGNAGLFLGVVQSANAVGGVGHAVVTLGMATGTSVTSTFASPNNPILCRISGGFAPNNVNVTFTDVDINPTINQQGTSAGKCFGINVHPTLTANAGGYSAYSTNVSSPALAFEATGTGKSSFGGDLVFASGVSLDYTTSGGAATAGTATLASGTVTVSTTAVKAGDKIFVTLNTISGSSSVYAVPTASITAATSFVINAYTAGATSVNTADNSTINWVILHSH